MLLPLIKTKVEVVAPPCQTSYKKLKAVESVKDGQIVRQSIYEDFDVSVDIADLSSDDFSIANLQSIGAVDMLKEMPLISSSAFKFVDGVENIHYELSKSEKSE